MPDKVIVNTTPIISLLKLQKVDLLKILYKKIIIPNAVFMEIEKGKNKPYYLDLSKESWIEIVKLKEQANIKYLMDLDQGEAEVIILADELKADLLIIDEILGRAYAKKLGFTITGTLELLLKAKEKQIIDKILPLLIELQEHGFWISSNIIKKVLILSEEH